MTIQSSSLDRRNRLHVKDGTEEVLDDASLALGASLLDALDLLVGILVGLCLGLLVALAVLGLELLVLVLLVGLVVGDLLLGFVAGLLDALCSDYKLTKGQDIVSFAVQNIIRMVVGPSSGREFGS